MDAFRTFSDREDILEYRQLLIHALQDKDHRVRNAAMRWMQRSKDHLDDDAKLSFCCNFSTDRRIRSTSLKLFRNSFGLFLLANPEADHQRICNILSEGRSVRLKGEDLQTILSFIEQGRLTNRAAFTLLSRSYDFSTVRTPESDALTGFLSRIPRDEVLKTRSIEPLKAFALDFPDPVADRLVDIIEIQEKENSKYSFSSTDFFIQELTARCFDVDYDWDEHEYINPPLTHPFSLSLVLAMIRRKGSFHNILWFRPLIWVFPELMTCRDLNRGLIRECCLNHNYFDRPHAERERPGGHDLIKILKGGGADVVRDVKSGAYDLDALWGLVDFFPNLKNPAKLLIEHLGLNPLLNAAVTDLETAFRFINAFEENDPGRQELTDAIFQHSKLGRIRIQLELLIQTPTEQITFFDELKEHELLKLLEGLFERLKENRKLLSKGKAKYVINRCVHLFSENSYNRVVDLWLNDEAPSKNHFACKLFSAIADDLEVERFGALVCDRSADEVNKLLQLFPFCNGIPYGKELFVAEQLRESLDAAQLAWATERLSKGSPREKEAEPLSQQGALPPEIAESIAEGDPAKLSAALEHASKGNFSGLTEALSLRAEPEPSVNACVALLRCGDSNEAVDLEFSRWRKKHDSFYSEVERTLLNCLENSIEASETRCDIHILGNAWLNRYNEHCVAFGEAVLEVFGESGIAQILELAGRLRCDVLSDQIWEAAARLLATWERHQPERFSTTVDEPLVTLLVDSLHRAYGKEAANMLESIKSNSNTAELLSSAIPRIQAQAHLYSKAVIDRLKRVIVWDDLFQMAEPTSDAKTKKAGSGRRLKESQAELVRLLHSDSDKIAAEAIEELVHLEAWNLLADAMLRSDDPWIVRRIAKSVPNWSKSAEDKRLMAAAQDPNETSFRRFILPLALALRGDPADKLIEHAFAALEQTEERSFFMVEDWHNLHRFVSEKELALRLVSSPHPVACARSVAALGSQESFDPATTEALLNFLCLEEPRPSSVRLDAALYLFKKKFFAGLPLLLENALDTELNNSPPRLKPEDLFAGVPKEIVISRVEACLRLPWFRNDEGAQERLLIAITASGVAPDARDRLLRILFVQTHFTAIRDRISGQLLQARVRDQRLRTLVNNFAWGVTEGIKLTRRRFRIQFPASEAALGYTRLTEHSIWISPFPILRSVQNSEAITRGLIVHEYGHHLYHADPTAQEIWEKAQSTGLGDLLNLVADEHLERRLRSWNSAYGDDLKALGAYAFHHKKQCFNIEELVRQLGVHAFALLTKTAFHSAPERDDAIIICGGSLLQELEREGNSFARFFRALRLGLGNRYDDPKVAEALSLFHGKFRQNSMTQLYEIAERLHEIFGDESQNQSLIGDMQEGEGSREDAFKESNGLSDSQLQAAIERVLRNVDGTSEKSSKSKDDEAEPAIFLNQSEDERFDPINQIVPLAPNKANQNELNRSVKRPARRLRQFLENLGLDRIRVGPTLSGRALDRSRLLKLGLYGEPRVMYRRMYVQATDLFIGVTVDCSGSMDYGDKIEDAKRFGSMIAEASKQLPGVDARFWGFTDHEIFDAGTAERCSVSELEAGGGNNDAAALWHAACEARRSGRKAKLLIMISDGSPTECSVAALEQLVRSLGKENICCAQIAVREISEVCFPHYVEIIDDDLTESMTRFGRTVAKLVGKTLSQ